MPLLRFERNVNDRRSLDLSKSMIDETDFPFKTQTRSPLNGTSEVVAGRSKTRKRLSKHARVRGFPLIAAYFENSSQLIAENWRLGRRVLGIPIANI